MCLILFGYKVHPQYKLVVIANRDEFYERPTQQASWWATHPEMLAGKDLKGNGSWFGVNKAGRFAALTNFRDGMILKQNAPTRGTLVTDFLTKPVDPLPYLQTLDEVADDYNGYNLLLMEENELYHYSNMEKKINPLQPGIYGLSNHLLDTSWPKVERGKAALADLLKIDDFSVEGGFQALLNETKAADKDLPSTGIPLDLERMLSSMCIKSENYGTRCSTVITIDYKGVLKFEERSYVPSLEAKKFEFQTSLETAVV